MRLILAGASSPFCAGNGIPGVLASISTWTNTMLISWDLGMDPDLQCRRWEQFNT